SSAAAAIRPSRVPAAPGAMPTGSTASASAARSCSRSPPARGLTSAELDLMAPRADVWAFLAEPYHLSDWWPGITGVDPDRRGFAPGARWRVHSTKRNVFTGSRVVETMILIREIQPYERWSWHLLEPATDVEVRLH